MKFQRRKLHEYLWQLNLFLIVRICEDMSAVLCMRDVRKLDYTDYNASSSDFINFIDDPSIDAFDGELKTNILFFVLLIYHESQFIGLHYYYIYTLYMIYCSSYMIQRFNSFVQHRNLTIYMQLYQFIIRKEAR